MFQQFEDKPHEPAWIGPRFIIGGAAAMFLSFGLCGMARELHIQNEISTLETEIGVWLFFLSIAAIVIGGIVTAVEVIIAISRGK